jgi:hypothetical protein
VEVTREDGTKEIVRFDAIDAPERTQPFGDKAKEFMEKACLNKKVTVRTAGNRDENNRLIGEVIVGETNLNRELLRQGLAWWFYHYSDDQSLGQLEVEAKAKRKGLFSEETPIYPRNWRRGARIRQAPPASTVFIMAIMPNPKGKDEGNETVILGNSGNGDASVEGWKLTDDDGGAFKVSGSVPANEAITIRLDKRLQLGNNGDSVTLLDAAGKKIHTVTYPNTPEGRFIVPSQGYREGE